MDFTIVVPTYNGANKIEHCLRGLKNLLIPSELKYEIIFVINNSKDNTVNIIQESKLTNYRMVNESTQGLFYARDRGIKEAQSDYVFFIDDDIEVQPNWITAFLDKIKESEKPGLLAAKLKFPESYKISPLIERFKSVYAIVDNIDTKHYFLSSMFCVNKKCYEELFNNGFHQKLIGRLENSDIKVVGGEDIEYSLALQYTDYKCYAVDNTFGIHYLGEDRLTKEKCLDYLIANGYINFKLAPLRYMCKFPFKYITSYYYFTFRTILAYLLKQEKYENIQFIINKEKLTTLKFLKTHKKEYQLFENEIRNAKWNKFNVKK